MQLAKVLPLVVFHNTISNCDSKNHIFKRFLQQQIITELKNMKDNLTNKLKGSGRLWALILIMFSLFCRNAFAQTLYVSAANGKNNALGDYKNPILTLDEAFEKSNLFKGDRPVTIVVAPGLYTIAHKLNIHTAAAIHKCEAYNITASKLPDQKGWQASDVPVIISISGDNSKDKFPHSEGLLIGQDNVSIIGLKFIGNPNVGASDYYPIRRADKSLNRLVVSQCYFIGESNSSPIQSAFWVSGPGIQVDHCIFHNCKIAFVLSDAVNDFSLTYSIIDGAYNTAMWYGFAGTTPNFRFENNVITNCYYVMVYPVEKGQPFFTFKNSFITNNQHFVGYYPKAQDSFIEEKNKNIKLVNVSTTGTINLVAVENDGITNNNLNISPKSAGEITSAGIFKKLPNK